MTETDSSEGPKHEAHSPLAAGPAIPPLASTAPPSPAEALAEPAESPPRWSVLRVVAYSAFVLALGFAAQIVAMGVWRAVDLARNPPLDADGRALVVGTDGDELGTATIASSLVCAALVMWLSRRRAPGRVALLGWTGVPPRSALPWVVGVAGLGVFADALWTAFDRSFLIEEWIAIASSTDSFALLLVALSVAAPVAEELLFRGLLLGGLRASGAATWLAVGASSAGWALIHVQYELPELALIFVLGLVLGAARVRTGSIVTPMLAHAVWNAISWAQLLQLQAP